MPIRFEQLHWRSLVLLWKVILFYTCIGSFQKRSILPPRRKFLPSRGEKKLFLIIVNVLGHPKGVNFLFPPWGWYGCFLEWPITALLMVGKIRCFTSGPREWSVSVVHKFHGPGPQRYSTDLGFTFCRFPLSIHMNSTTHRQLHRFNSCKRALIVAIFTAASG
jgi:hypothetical protein